ncbi:hypothetical protein [Akkermansia muciniphila]|uniref:hypothetical protein n=1 Tax=Akkermansia muciniphila TaxID=239935 RepID=UPI0011AEE8D7|nr:hypothetical protein [Akkermansia muciniphila]
MISISFMIIRFFLVLFRQGNGFFRSGEACHVPGSSGFKSRTGAEGGMKIAGVFRTIMPRRVKVFSCRASACPFLGILPGKKLREIREDKTFGEEHETQRDRSSRFGTVETASGEDAPFRDAGKDGMPERGLDSVPFRVWNKSAYY